MVKDARSAALTAGVIGTGAMGRGIAQIMATGGMDVLMYDATEGAAESGRAFAERMIRRAAEKGTLTDNEAKAAVGRLKTVGALGDLAPCDLVVEAVVENLEVKRQVFGELESIVGPDCILATNTSSLSVTAIATALERRDRMAGFHFFNPVPVMNTARLAGNFVALDCGDFHVILAHLRQGSVRVREGQAVTAGEPVGELGKSGNSSEPHLHVHAQRGLPPDAPLSGEPLWLNLTRSEPVAWAILSVMVCTSSSDGVRGRGEVVVAIA